jgi:hypothetical protein
LPDQGTPSGRVGSKKQVCVSNNSSFGFFWADARQAKTPVATIPIAPAMKKCCMVMSLWLQLKALFSDR